MACNLINLKGVNWIRAKLVSELMSNKYFGKRLIAMSAREEVIQYGLESSELPGIFASLLGDIPDETMNYLLQKRLKELAVMSSVEFMELPGIGSKKALQLAAAFELARRIARSMPLKRPSIKGPLDVAALLTEEMRHLNQEHFVILLLNTKNQVIRKETITIGTLNSAQVHPRELFKPAIRYSAASIIMVHNHPSGDQTASNEDIKVTKSLVETGKLIGIHVLDHIIIGANGYTSMKEKGLID